MSYEPTVWVDGDHVTSAKLNKLEQGVNSMSYTPTVWNAGDVVTAEKLNKLEQGVAEGGGGGGGDFSIAEVTFVNTASTGSYTVGCVVFTDETGFNIEAISVRGNSSDTVPVPIYKSVPFVLDFTNFRDVDENVMPTVSGSIEMGASGFSISGDGTITLKGVEEQ